MLSMPFIQKLRQRPAVVLVLEVLSRAARHHITSYAAALTYYTLLSVIPLLFFVLSVGSLFINAGEVEAVILGSLTALLPTAADTIRINIESLVHYRGTMGVMSGLVALWSASGMFTVLETAINVVWERDGGRTFWEQRLLGVLSLFGVTVWVLFAFLTRIVFMLNLIVFRFFPAADVHKRLSIGIGLVVSVVWVLVREAFALALTAGLLNYPLVYGSFWVAVVTIVWVNLSYHILLYGAEIQAYLQERREQGREIL
jgi:membrane protein